METAVMGSELPVILLCLAAAVAGFVIGLAVAVIMAVKFEWVEEELVAADQPEMNGYSNLDGRSISVATLDRD